MNEGQKFSADGGCTCRAVRYRLTREPLIVHCCHCRWCQRETGSAFALNALIESANLELLAGKPELVPTPSNSGKGQQIARCPTCRVALWSYYGGLGDVMSFVRVGTLDEPDRLPPAVHIYTESKQPWVALPAGARAFKQYYKSAEVWSKESLARRQALLAASR
ncbi:MAG TPA: GFA family protein [Steroidobacteraceae bacterium]|nr:GFA family protein [Steroidobacteraceae bacterium]